MALSAVGIAAGILNMAIVAGIMVPHPPLIIPEVGQGQEERIPETVKSYKKAAEFIAAQKPQAIVIITPHTMLYSDYFHISPGAGASGDFSRFGAPQVKFSVNYDEEFVRELSDAAQKAGVAAGTLGERDKTLDHAALVPIAFLRKAGIGEDTKRVRIGLSGLPLADHYRLGQLIKATAEKLGRRTVIIGSGDLSHRLKEDGPYGFNPDGPRYDKRIMKVMGAGAFGELFDFGETFCESAAECGHRSFVIMAGAFDGTSVEAERLSYEGPFGVGYGVCLFRPTAPDAKRNFLSEFEKKDAARLAEIKKKEDAYVRLARAAVEEYVKSGRIIEVPADLPKEITGRRAGAFVSLKKDGRLRGCIGSIGPSTPSLAHEIINYGICAAVQDSRFVPVTPGELSKLVYSVDVLGESEKIDSPSQLDVKRYGVIVTNGGRRGLLLPDIEGVNTVEEQIAIAKQKAGIGENEPVTLERFEVVRHH